MISLRDFIDEPNGDGLYDDSDAFRGAFAAVQAAKGGHLEIPSTRLDGSPAMWRLRGPWPCSLDMGSGWSAASVKISGYGARVLMTTDGSPYAPWQLTNISALLIEGIAFYGYHPDAADHPEAGVHPLSLRNLLDLGGSDATLRDVTINGVKCDDFAGYPGIVAAQLLRLQNVTFAGCGGSAPSVDMRGGRVLVVEGCTFADFYNVNNAACAPAGSTITAIRFAPSDDAQQSVYGSARVSLRGLVLDEGGGAIVIGKAGGPALGFVDIDGVRQNVSPSNGSVGIDLANVQHAAIRNLWTREGGQGSAAIRCREVGSIEIERTATIGNGPLATVDIEADAVRIASSHFDRTGITAGRLVDGDA